MTLDSSPAGRGSWPERSAALKPARRLLRGLGTMLGLCVLVLASGCASVQASRDAVPEKLQALAQPPGISGPVRIWGDQPLTAQQVFNAVDETQVKARLLRQANSGLAVQSNILALSGGGDDGAFGAGLLVGWSAHGDRPQFDLVSGVSTGALIAPFAFLGRDYDHTLTDVFTRTSGDKIYEANVISGLFGGSAIANNEPLKELIAKYVDQRMLARIAAERAKGRFLLIGTTNIDAQRPVYWDMGRIAASSWPGAPDLFRSVLLASAAIPGVFPPVRIRVTADGQTYEELHVDGGTTREVFFSPADFSFKDFDRFLGVPIQRHLYVVRNGKTGAEWGQTEETAFALGQRALSTVIKAQSLGDIDRLYTSAVRDGIDYNLAAIPDSFKAGPHPPFDQTYMTSLYAAGYALARRGYPWRKSPAGPATLAGR